MEVPEGFMGVSGLRRSLGSTRRVGGEAGTRRSRATGFGGLVLAAVSRAHASCPTPTGPTLS